MKNVTKNITKNIAVLGPSGTFSQCAAEKYIQTMQIEAAQMFFPTIDDVFDAVSNDCQIGIVPIENTLEGYVSRSIDLLYNSNVRIVDEITIPVKFSLVANVSNASEITTLYVQFKAKGQCRKFISTLANVRIVTTESNMESFELAARGRKGEAAIIPHHMQDAANSEFVVCDVTDSLNNFTRFFVLAPYDEMFTLKDDLSLKAVLYITPEVDRPGVLIDILKYFSENKINLISIMSRPTRKNIGTYNFYIELDGKFHEKALIVETVETIKKLYSLKVLGLYSIKIN